MDTSFAANGKRVSLSEMKTAMEEVLCAENTQIHSEVV